MPRVISHVTEEPRYDAGGNPTKPCFEYQKGQCRHGDRCFFSHSNAKHHPCFAFMKGECKEGKNCRYSHDVAPLAKGANTCFNFLKGTCEHGDNCRYSHDVEPTSTKGGASGSSRTKGKRLCIHFAKRGVCEHGDNCGFLHGDEDTRFDLPAAGEVGHGAKVKKCVYFFKPGGQCRNVRYLRGCPLHHGDACKFSHDTSAGRGGGASSQTAHHPSPPTHQPPPTYHQPPPTYQPPPPTYHQPPPTYQPQPHAAVSSGNGGRPDGEAQVQHLLAQMDNFTFTMAPGSGGGSGGGSSGGSGGSSGGGGGGGGGGGRGGFTSMASERETLQTLHHDEGKAAPTAEDECCVCMDARRGCVLVPCGHTNLCWPCAQELVGAPLAAGQSPPCPICQQPVQNLFQARI